MSYGLYDGDLRLYPQVPFFNLELMKMATYYKQKREIVSLSLDFKPNMYSHFLVRQDYPTNFIYPTYTNIVYGGRAFDGSKYKPLDIKIEQCHPDVSIYDRVKIPHLDRTTVKTALSTMRRAEHVRLSLDGKTIWKDWDKQLRHHSNAYGLIVHDYNLGELDGAHDLIKNNIEEIISHSSGRRLGMKFPVITTTNEDFVKWFSFNIMGSFFNLQHNGIILPEYFEQIKEIYYPDKSTPVSINVTSNTTYEEFITTGINEVLKSILDLRRYHIVFPLIYDKGFFADSRWVEVIELIRQFNNYTYAKRYDSDYFTRQAPYQTVYSYIKRFVKDEQKYGYTTRRKDKANRIFQFVRENNYELFKMFYEYTGELK